MGHRRPKNQRRSCSACQGEQDVAVTPVIGAVLILGISVLGIAGVLFWGAPLLERIQANNAQAAMVGEFEDLRDASRELSVPDHSRFPTVAVARGELSLQAGSRLMVTSDSDAGYTGCDFHVTGWSDSDNSVTVATTGCRPGATTQLYSVSGSTLTSANSYQGTGGPRDWLWQLRDAACTAGNGVCAQAWLQSGDRIAWTTDSSAGHRAVYLDSGSIFSDTDGTYFLEKEAVVGDATFGQDYYGLWLRTISAGAYTSISGSGSHQVYLSLRSNDVRVDQPGTYRIRYDASGPLAQPWCNSLVSRNRHIPAGTSYASQVTTTTCGPLDASGVRSICYAKVAANPCSTVGSAFVFRFLQARIYATIAL